MECPFEDLLGVVSRRWALLLIAALGKGERRFVELMSDLEGISPRSLSDVLNDLVDLGLVERRPYAGSKPPRVGYSLTSRGAGLRDSALPLLHRAAELRPEADCPILRMIEG